MVVLQTLEVPPADVRFTQDSISESFGERDQSPIDPETIEDTFRKLLYGDVTVNTIRTISVVRKDGRMWVVSGNRRLYVFKKLQEFGRIRTIRVNVVALNQDRFEKMFTTKNDGKSIYIRQDRKRQRGDKLHDRLNNIYRKWLSQGSPTDGQRFDDPYFSGGSAWSPPDWPPTTSRTSTSSYAEPARPATLPRPVYVPQQRPVSALQEDDSWCVIERPPPAKKDDSWCAIL